MKNRKKKSIIALLVIALLGFIGGTFAYFTSSDTFSNIFSTKPYRMEVVETFESPSNWTPGTTTPKTIIARNTGDVEAAVRISYTEEWKDSNGGSMPLVSNGIRAAVINVSSDLNTKWTQSTEGGKTYYYYKTKIGKNQSTSSFIQSVTFNKDVEINLDSNCVENSSLHTKTCTTTSGGYSSGTYTLTIKVETVQFDQYRTVWGTNVSIA